MPDENEIKLKNRRIIAIALIVLIFIVAPPCIYLANTFGSKTAVQNSSSSNLDNIPNNQYRILETGLKSLLSNSYDYSEEDLSDLKIIIRENTVTYTYSKDQVTGTNFLLDVDKLNLTYDVTLEYASEGVFFRCPSLELMKDPNIFCVGTDKQSTIDVALDKYLPYRGKTKSGYSFSIWHDYDDKNNPRIEMYANICNDQKKGAEILQTIKDWIKDKGVNPDIVPINYQESYCEHS